MEKQDKISQLHQVVGGSDEEITKLYQVVVAESQRLTEFFKKQVKCAHTAKTKPSCDIIQFLLTSIGFIKLAIENCGKEHDVISIMLYLIKIKYQNMKTSINQNRKIDLLRINKEIEFIEKCQTMTKPIEYFEQIQKYITIEKDLWRFNFNKLADMFVEPLERFFGELLILSEQVKEKTTKTITILKEKQETNAIVRTVYAAYLIGLEFCNTELMNSYSRDFLVQQCSKLREYIINSGPKLDECTAIMTDCGTLSFAISKSIKLFPEFTSQSKLLLDYRTAQLERLHLMEGLNDLAQVTETTLSALVQQTETAVEKAASSKALAEKAVVEQEKSSKENIDATTLKAIAEKVDFARKVADEDEKKARLAQCKLEQEAKCFQTEIEARLERWRGETLRSRQEKEAEKHRQQKAQHEIKNKESELAERQIAREKDAIKPKALALFCALSDKNLSTLNIIFGIELGKIRYSELNNLFGKLATQIPGKITTKSGSHRTLVVQFINGSDFTGDFDADPDEEIKGGIFEPHGTSGSWLPPVVIELVRNTLIKAHIFREHLQDFMDQKLGIVDVASTSSIVTTTTIANTSRVIETKQKLK